ncbi:MAG: hypothetical protein KBD01_19375 [Acidobacteria bacterium]|nr:hypothetical protein [Acidobacteriota bacterium]
MSRRMLRTVIAVCVLAMAGSLVLAIQDLEPQLGYVPKLGDFQTPRYAKLQIERIRGPIAPPPNLVIKDPSDAPRPQSAAGPVANPRASRGMGGGLAFGASSRPSIRPDSRPILNELGRAQRALGL